MIQDLIRSLLLLSLFPFIKPWNRPLVPDIWSVGGIWPQPWKAVYLIGNHSIHPGNFQFKLENSLNCEIIEKAFQRYRILAFPGYNQTSYSGIGTLKALIISFGLNCPIGVPPMDMDEKYSMTINITSDVGEIRANTVWGALRALESFSQLIFQPDDNMFQIRSVHIEDHPRFKWRGILLDSSRHFLPIPILLENLDLMSQNKMNVFHWHIVDSESFPYNSKRFEELSQFGAYSKEHQYRIDDIKKVIQYARLRGIRVVVEFDTPGHMQSWGRGMPNLTAKCFQSNNSNIIDPTIPGNLLFLKEFFTEILDIFSDQYIHLGGDEVIDDIENCWLKNPQLLNRMHKMGIRKALSLLQYYWNRLFKIISNSRNGTKAVVWQDIVDEGIKIGDSIVQIWKGETMGEAFDHLDRITQQGHQVLFSSCWYLNRIRYGADWGDINADLLMKRGMYYQCDPQGFHGNQQQKDRVIGGEAVLWGEYVDATNLISRLWPRASAVAERLWSNPESTRSIDKAWPRLHEHRCRMVRRGFRVQPLSYPDYCPHEFEEKYQGI